MSTRTALTSSVSFQAICFYWRHHPAHDLMWGWMVLCFPLEAVYVRLLKPSEQRQWRTGGNSMLPWYGAFNQFTFALISVSSSSVQLCQELRNQGYYPMLIA